MYYHYSWALFDTKEMGKLQFEDVKAVVERCADENPNLMRKVGNIQADNVQPVFNNCVDFFSNVYTGERDAAGHADDADGSMTLTQKEFYIIKHGAWNPDIEKEKKAARAARSAPRSTIAERLRTSDRLG